MFEIDSKKPKIEVVDENKSKFNLFSWFRKGKESDEEHEDNTQQFTTQHQIQQQSITESPITFLDEQTKNLIQLITVPIGEYIDYKINQIQRTLKDIANIIQRHEQLLISLSGRVSQLETSSQGVVMEYVIKSAIKGSIETILHSELQKITQLVERIEKDVVDYVSMKVDEKFKNIESRVNEVETRLNQYLQVLDGGIDKLTTFSKEVARISDILLKLQNDLNQVFDKIKELERRIEGLSEAIEILKSEVKKSSEEKRIKIEEEENK